MAKKNTNTGKKLFDSHDEVKSMPEDEIVKALIKQTEADPVGVMAFAPRPRVAAVMSFNQPATPRADEAARDMTQRLIQAVRDS